MRLAKTIPLVALSVMIGGCGSGGGSTLTAAAPPSEVTTTRPSDVTTTRPSDVTTTQPAATTTAPVVPVTPGPPRAPVTGPLTTPPTAARTDALLPKGVPDVMSPPQTPATDLLRNLECGKLLRSIRGPITPKESPTSQAWVDAIDGIAVTTTGINLYLAAGEACLANWGPAEKAFSQVATGRLCPVGQDGLLPPQSSFATVADCKATRLSVYNWTQNLLKAHRANPAFVPRFPRPPVR